jgi:hypothetical protein
MGPLLTYILSGVPDSTEQWSQCFPFHPVESGGEAGARRRGGGGVENRPHSARNRLGQDSGSVVNSVSDFVQ